VWHIPDHLVLSGECGTVTVNSPSHPDAMHTSICYPGPIASPQLFLSAKTSAFSPVHYLFRPDYATLYAASLIPRVILMCVLGYRITCVITSFRSLFLANGATNCYPPFIAATLAPGLRILGVVSSSRRKPPDNPMKEIKYGLSEESATLTSHIAQI